MSSLAELAEMVPHKLDSVGNCPLIPKSLFVFGVLMLAFVWGFPNRNLSARVSIPLGISILFVGMLIAWMAF